MEYRDYQFITDLIDRHKQKVEDDYRTAIIMGARYEDVFPSLRSEQVRNHDVKKMLKDCISAYVKEKQPDNIELQRFWSTNENN